MAMRKIYGRKGVSEAPGFLSMEVILPAVAGIIIVSFIIIPFIASIMPTDARADIGLAERYCNMNAGVRNAIMGGAKWVMPLWFCHERSVKVDANNWDVCDPDGKFELEKMAKEDDKEYEATRRCAAQQFYNLGKRCWYMYGQNRFNMQALEIFRTGCFKATVRDLQGTIGESELTDASIRADGCKYLQNSAGPKKCGSYDGMDFADWTTTAEIKTGKTHYICFDDAGGGHDQIDYRENPC